MTYDRLPRRNRCGGFAETCATEPQPRRLTCATSSALYCRISHRIGCGTGTTGRRELGGMGTRMEHQRLRASSYLLSALPLAVTVTILWGRFGAIGAILSAAGVWLWR